MAAVQPESKIGTGTLLGGKYKVTREIGRGGMAAVYEAENVSIGKKVAVKVLASELSGSAIVIERFFREARAAASVKSPHIVEIYDSGRLEDGRPFIAMELLEGESLYDRMARVRLIDAETTVKIITQVAKGLTKAHAANIVHRDLKPENIHLCHTEDGDEVTKILDFGLAKFYAPVKTDEKTARLTREGAVFGTPAYMSPEQVKGQGNVDHRADLWALGCMAYECLTGRPVWNTDQGVAMTFAAIAAAALPVPSRMRADLPPSFDAWFVHALERDPAKRFQTAKELADELSRALGAQGPLSLSNVGPHSGSPSQIEMEALSQNPEAIASLEERQAPPRSVERPATPRVQGSDAGSADLSQPIDLLRSRTPALSATDLPPTAAPETAPMSSRRGGGAGRVLASILLMGGAATAAWFLYTRVLHRPIAPAALPVVVAPPASAPSASESAAPVAPPPEMPKWMGTIEEGQAALAAGDPDAALRKFKEASDAGGGAIAKSFLDQVKLGVTTTGPCKLASFSHPRLGYGGSIGRPALAVTSKGTVVAWTDDHEQPMHDHVYSVLVDDIGRPTSRPRNLTPEADYAMRPELLAVGDRVALLFWDKSGREPGVHMRWLDADGRIGGMSTLVGAAGPGQFWPAVDRAGDGTFWLAWQNNPDKDGDEIFLRHVDPELKPLGPEIRATDYPPSASGKSVHVNVPSIAVTGANLFVAYALERDKQHLVERMRIPLASPDLATGLTGTSKTTRELGEVATSNEDRIGGDFPQIACATDACVLVWHEIEKGAQAALIDPVKGTMLWRKRFAPRGGHPAVATNDALTAIAYYEAGRVRLAGVSRDGVGTTSTFAKVTGDAPRPWLAPGHARGEWVVGWLDVEAGHTEAFVSRMQCRN